MLTKMMEWVSKHILLAPFMCLLVVFLLSCKSQKPIVTTEKTTITITERDVPVFTPMTKVNASGKIIIDPNGLPKLGVLKITDNSNKPPDKQPKISVNLDKVGNLNVDVVIPEDTFCVKVNDTTKVTTTSNTEYVEVEKDLTWIQQTLIYVGVLAVIIVLVWRNRN